MPDRDYQVDLVIRLRVCASGEVTAIGKAVARVTHALGLTGVDVRGVDVNTVTDVTDPEHPGR